MNRSLTAGLFLLFSGTAAALESPKYAFIDEPDPVKIRLTAKENGVDGWLNFKQTIGKETWDSLGEGHATLWISDKKGKKISSRQFKINSAGQLQESVIEIDKSKWFELNLQQAKPVADEYGSDENTTFFRVKKGAFDYLKVQEKGKEPAELWVTNNTYRSWIYDYPNNKAYVDIIQVINDFPQTGKITYQRIQGTGPVWEVKSAERPGQWNDREKFPEISKFPPR